MPPTRPSTQRQAIRRLTAVTAAELDSLADLLIDCVEGGASVSFMHPLPRAKALAFWRNVADDAARGARALFVAEDGSGASSAPCNWCSTSRRTSRTAPTCRRCSSTAVPAAAASVRP